jgi:hypothetical protein
MEWCSECLALSDNLLSYIIQGKIYILMRNIFDLMTQLHFSEMIMGWFSSMCTSHWIYTNNSKRRTTLSAKHSLHHSIVICIYLRIQVSNKISISDELTSHWIYTNNSKRRTTEHGYVVSLSVPFPSIHVLTIWSFLLRHS